MFRKRKRSYRKTMDSGEAIVLIVLGILLGTVFTFGEYYWNQPIVREEAIYVDATFSRYRQPEEKKSKLRIGNSRIVIGKDSDITLEFFDHEDLAIDEGCITDTLLMQLQTLKSGDSVACVVHPNSNKVMEMYANNELLLSFDDTASQLSSEQRVGFALGIIMYIGAIRGLLHFLMIRRRHR